jgi:serine/threonine protein phosphatase PrpC
MFRGRQLTRSGAATAFAPALAPLPTTMLVEFTQISDLGRVREGNEDCLGSFEPGTAELVRSHGWLFAVADGVGGHDQGEVASHLAIETLVEGFRTATAGESHGALLARLVQRANTNVIDAGQAAHVGMATTMAACALRFDRATVAHVGDSRCYLLRKGQAIQLTRDHTVASEQFRLGVLSASEANQADTRHILSRSLGAELVVKVDVSEHQVFAGDVLLLCSDGLHGSVSGSEMAALLGPGADLKSAAQRLVDIANQRDGGDNSSAQIIRIQNVERVGMYRGRPYRLP